MFKLRRQPTLEGVGKLLAFILAALAIATPLVAMTSAAILTQGTGSTAQFVLTHGDPTALAITAVVRSAIFIAIISLGLVPFLFERRWSAVFLVMALTNAALVLAIVSVAGRSVPFLGLLRTVALIGLVAGLVVTASDLVLQARFTPRRAYKDPRAKRAFLSQETLFRIGDFVLMATLALLALLTVVLTYDTASRGTPMQVTFGDDPGHAVESIWSAEGHGGTWLLEYVEGGKPQLVWHTGNPIGITFCPDGFAVCGPSTATPSPSPSSAVSTPSPSVG